MADEQASDVPEVSEENQTHSCGFEEDMMADPSFDEESVVLPCPSTSDQDNAENVPDVVSATPSFQAGSFTI